MTAIAPVSTAGALAERTFADVVATVELACIYLGDRLRLYDALRPGPVTAAELAARAGTDKRYTREWLEQQAAAGILECDDPAAPPAERRFALPDGHATALTEPEAPEASAGMARSTVGLLSALPLVLDAFRTGAGVSYADYGEDTREGIADMNRPMFAHQLAAEWLPAVPDLQSRLMRAPAYVADIGCGLGWSTLAIARAYPLARVDGIDEDARSIERAREQAVEAGLADRARFRVCDAADVTGSYDLVTIFEALHDMARPVEVLRAARALLAAGGTAIVADERVADTFAPPGDDFERYCYGVSVLHCLPIGRVGRTSEATGTVMRPGTVRDYATRAGFASVEVLPIDHDLWRFYRLRP